MNDQLIHARPDAIGWVGRGAMGRPMASQLEKVGFRVVPLAMRPARDGSALRAALEGVTVVVTSLPGPNEVRDVWAGPDGLLELLAPGATLIDTSTIGAATAIELARLAEERGIAALDCPVSGGPQGAMAGTLAVMVGGSPLAVERVRPVLEALGDVHHCGAAGAGQSVKLINQCVLAGMLGGLGMGFALTDASGADPTLVHSVLSGGVVRGFLTDAMWPLMATQNLEVGFGAPLMIKDLRLGREFAQERGVSTELLDAVEKWLVQAVAVAGPQIATQGISLGLRTPTPTAP